MSYLPLRLVSFFGVFLTGADLVNTAVNATPLFSACVVTKFTPESAVQFEQAFSPAAIAEKARRHWTKHASNLFIDATSG